MDYYRFDIQVSTEQSDVLIALLSNQGFEAFQELEDGIQAYLPIDGQEAEAEEFLQELQQQFSFSYQKELQQEQNWNEVWESNFHPIQIGNFCGVRATFHPPMPDVEYEIIIQPKMSFGTGHHATTYMMIQHMQDLPMTGKKVWDYGSGTGILAILAAKMGARHIDANDIDEWAYENARENVAMNGTPHITVIHGALEAMLPQLYDIILANITLNVISPSLPTLYEWLNPGGYLVVSGFLTTDIPKLEAEAKQLGFQTESQLENGEWACVKFVKS